MTRPGTGGQAGYARDGALHADALALLRAWQAPGPEQEARRRRFVDHLGRRRDGLRRECRPDHVTASTLVVSADLTRVLLTLHAKAGAWFQTGGHCEPEDTTLAGAALREAVEESGVLGLALDREPVQLDEHEVAFCGDGGTVHHLDVRFVATAPEEAEHVVGVESLDLAWWPVDALPSDEPGLLSLVRLGLARLRGQSAVSSASI